MLYIELNNYLNKYRLIVTIGISCSFAIGRNNSVYKQSLSLPESEMAIEIQVYRNKRLSNESFGVSLDVCMFLILQRISSSSLSSFFSYKKKIQSFTKITLKYNIYTLLIG